MYDNERDAGSYLNHTVCWWDGRPIWVERVGNGFATTVYALPLGNRSEPFSIDIRDKRFECMKYELGYINWSDGHAVYAQRRPNRGVQQGLCDNNTVMTGNADRLYLISAAIREQGFVDMLLGNYPSIKEAHTRMDKKGVRGVAFGRKLALARHDNFNNLFYLRYRGRDVSWSDCAEFNLPEEYGYLYETCQPTGAIKSKVA